MRAGRNDKCHCGSGKKYKRCCLTEDEETESLKRRVETMTRRDLISGPYRKCPNLGCAAENTFGVFMTIAGSNSYTRECFKCGYEESFALPKIKKKVLYIDQFVISNLIKLLDKSHSSHERIKSDPFWETLFIKLEKASKSQAIVCPDSFYHRDESLTGNIDFKLMKRLYEHFSNGKTLYPSVVIEKNQITKHFEAWLEKRKVAFSFAPEEVSFEGDLHSWSVGLHVSVGGGAYPGQLENLQKVNTATREELKKVWKRWQTEKNVSFVERVREETLGLGKGLVGVAKKFATRRALAITKMTQGENVQMELDDFVPPMSNDIIESLVRIIQSTKLPPDQVPTLLVDYFKDADALLEIPQIKISSVMLAGLAHQAANGKKDSPKSTVDIQFISSYLPYCEALFVDKESHELLKELPKNTPENLRLKEFGAKVFSLRNKEEFLNYLDQIVSEVPQEQIDMTPKFQTTLLGEHYRLASPAYEDIQDSPRSP